MGAVDHDLGALSPLRAGTQALERGLAVLEAVAGGCTSLAEIGAATGCTRSTTQRLAAALLRRGWLGQGPDGAYRLGDRLARLAIGAEGLAELARPVLERLGHDTQDTVHLGVRAGHDVLYADKVPGRRGLEMRSRRGQRMPLALTGVGRALLLDAPEAEWAAVVAQAEQNGAALDRVAWFARMRAYRDDGVVFDLEDNERGINCVAAPVRVAGCIRCAVSVASATPYLPAERMPVIAPLVLAAAADLQRLLSRNGDGA